MGAERLFLFLLACASAANSSVKSEHRRRYVTDRNRGRLEGCDFVAAVDSDYEVVSCRHELPIHQFAESDARALWIDSAPVTVPWNLERIYDGQYVEEALGRRTTYYSVDTGVQGDVESEFGNRVQVGANFAADETGGYRRLGGATNGNVDCNGHGTHTSSTAGGRVFGVANQTSIYPVRVLDCDGAGYISDIARGLEHIIQTILINNTKRNVVGISLSGSYSPLLNRKVAQLTAMGAVVVVSAGNTGLDACFRSPASEETALTVCSTDQNDILSWFSSTGPCVDLCAPGEFIQAIGTRGQIKVRSGTSMSQPLVAGIALAFWGKYPHVDGDRVREFIMENATPDVRKASASGTTNLLAQILSRTMPPAARLCVGADPCPGNLRCFFAGTPRDGFKCRHRMFCRGIEGISKCLYQTIAASSGTKACNYENGQCIPNFEAWNN